jgi:hypothetical protein
VVLHAKDNVVTWIEIVPLTMGAKTGVGIPLRAIVQQLGPPCGIGFLGLIAVPRLLYPSMRINVRFSSKRMGLEAYINSIIIGPEDKALLCTSTPDRPLERWKGFVRLSRYLGNN